MFDFERLKVWERSVALYERVCEICRELDKEDSYSLGEHLRRASLSISTNVAEGSGRKNRKEKNYFYTIAHGSAFETASLIMIVKKKGKLMETEYRKLYTELEEISKMLIGMIK